MERKVGEIFEFNGIKLQVVKDPGFKNACIGCYFLDNNYNCSHRQKCFASQRKDLTSVKFIKIEN